MPMTTQEQKARDYFHSKYPAGKCYENPIASVPMLLHLYEQGEKQNELLARIVKLLSLEKQ